MPTASSTFCSHTNLRTYIRSAVLCPFLRFSAHAGRTYGIFIHNSGFQHGLDDLQYSPVLYAHMIKALQEHPRSCRGLEKTTANISPQQNEADTIPRENADNRYPKKVHQIPWLWIQGGSGKSAKRLYSKNDSRKRQIKAENWQDCSWHQENPALLQPGTNGGLGFWEWIFCFLYFPLLGNPFIHDVQVDICQ